MNDKTKNYITKLQTLMNNTLILVFLVFATLNMSAQCPLVLTSKVQVSMDVDCYLEVTPDMVLQGEGLVTDCEYTVIVMGSNGAPIDGSPYISSEHVGMTFKVKVLNGHNSGWSTIVIEDKLAPVIMCLDDLTISCYDNRVFALPTAIDNCSETADVTVKIVANELMSLNCDPVYSAIRTISYQATDEYNNTSVICERVISYTRIGLDSIVVPRSYDNIDLGALTCDNIENWDLNGNGYPEITETGVPETTTGFPILPNTSFCKINTSFSDQVIEICGGSFKVLRQWTILDWCTGEVAMPYQIIKVLDVTAPYANFDETSIVVSAESYDCLVDWEVIDPKAKDYCSEASYTIAYYYVGDDLPIPEGVHFTNVPLPTGNGKYIVNDLQIGFTWIRYKLIDECGNYEYYYLNVEVTDDVAPTAICDEFTVVTLSNNGMALIWAKTFDDGSHDNCTDVIFHARRMDPYVCDSTNTLAWKESVNFCCDDVGEEVMVAMRVTDEHGNTNTCMVIVTVQDKKPPEIFCPNDLTVNCGTDLYDLSILGEATAIDNCADPEITYTDVDGLNQCGRGMIWRTWKATDKGGRMAICVQKITVIDSFPFNEGYIDWIPVADIELIGCEGINTDPEITGKPEWSKDNCKLIASSYTDQVYTFVDSVCYKIVRTWAIIDWCTYDPVYPERGGLFRHNQIIKISNKTAPVFDDCKDTEHCIYDEDCHGYTNLEMSATDDCTPIDKLKWQYEVYLFDSETIDYHGYTNSLSEIIPIGKHKIIWKVEDKCGNISKCEKYFTVVDCKKPTPYCIGEITTVLMPVNQSIQIWASDFNFGSFDNCTPKEDLFVSFSQDTSDRYRMFDCDDLGENTLQVWITDEAGNSDFCEVTIDIQDNTGICTGGGSGLVGNVSTDKQFSVNNVEVSLQNNEDNVSLKAMTDQSGMYYFNTPKPDVEYQISAYKNDDSPNGVSTLDLVIIQQHVLGFKKFETPYQLIAADVNNNGTITAADLVILRKMVLGKIDLFPNNMSWRFLPKQDFVDELHPWPFLESIYFDYKGQMMTDLSFMAVKVGDVNNTVNVDGNNVGSRSKSSIGLHYNVEYSNKNNTVRIPISVEENQKITGLQMSLLMEKGNSIIGVESGGIDINDNNFFVKEVDGASKVNISWSDHTAKVLEENEILFYIIAKVGNEEVDLKLSRQMEAELYTDEMDIKEIKINQRNKSLISSKFTLMQNLPNPFTDKTSFRFYLPKSGSAKVSIFDLTGRQIFSETNVYNQGQNQYEVRASKLIKEGVYYLQIEFEGYTKTKSFILL